MTDITTIKVSRRVRDALQQRAARDRSTLGQVVERLLERDERALRFEAMRAVKDWSLPERDVWEDAAVADIEHRDPGARSS